ncbi:hypothetical protein [Rhizobium leucaenae]|uniref:hypothetical protein n=1 Tax=Rhizobium leucaenae TaxID=29450 RepID=UPI00160F2785|nr:hypothetical protein [Rhizobium leucaenae]MBB6299880.1 hypothetical protein [Rhizobium leucaenae]
MSEMIEKVARAICLAELPTDSKWELCVPAARAAIEAMRDLPAGHPILNAGATTTELWRRAIDAALKEGK